MVVFTVKVFRCVFLFNLLFFVPTSYYNASSHHREEPGPGVPDDLLVGMKGLLLGACDSSFFRLKQPSSPSLLTTLMAPPLGLLPVHVFSESEIHSQAYYSRYS